MMGIGKQLHVMKSKVLREINIKQLAQQGVNLLLEVAFLLVDCFIGILGSSARNSEKKQHFLPSY